MKKHERVVKRCPTSRTKGSFRDECDINVIMRRFQRSGGRLGDLPNSQGNGSYGDFSELPDYQTALATVIAAEANFEALPSIVRKRFNNDPGELLDFLSDEGNREEAVKLGLVSGVERGKAPPSPETGELAPFESPNS